jgi:hypothetical protein
MDKIKNFIFTQYEPKWCTDDRLYRFTDVKPLEKPRKILPVFHDTYNGRFYKLLAAHRCHNCFVYNEGLNVDTVPFVPSGDWGPGGLHYTSFAYISHWCESLIADVEVPPEAQVYTEPGGMKWKADRLVLSNIRPLRSFLATLDETTLCDMVAQNGLLLEFVSNQTDAMCRIAVQQNAFALAYVNNQSEDLCLLAVCKDWEVHRHVRNRSDKILLAVVQQHESVLEHIEQSEALCLAAVQWSGCALKYVRNQTEAICRAAVAQTHFAKMFVKIPIDF